MRSSVGSRKRKIERMEAPGILVGEIGDRTKVAEEDRKHKEWVASEGGPEYIVLTGIGEAMRFPQDETPEVAMRRVTEDIIIRAIKEGKKKNRAIYISKSAKGEGVPVSSLDPSTPGGRQRMDAFLTPAHRRYTFHGLGAPEEPNAINWRKLNLPTGRKILVLLQVAISFFLKGTPAKNKLYRSMGAHIGKNVEIMQMVWLDHYRPELIFIGNNTLLGAFTRITVHAYEGCGRFSYGIVEIGNNCMIGAGTGIGPIIIEDGVRTLPGATLSPYLARVRAGSVIGFSPPAVRLPDQPTVDEPKNVVQDSASL
jgi:acetyltransferase-like isoleucine patch superfamily enzyme